MKKPYLMNITEKFTKQVIVWAEDRTEAVELIEELCNRDAIPIEDGTFNRDVFVQFKAEGYDFDVFPQYNADLECAETWKKRNV